MAAASRRSIRAIALNIETSIIEDRRILPGKALPVHRTQVYAAIGLGLIAGAVALYGVGDWCVWSPDGFWYLTHAHALAKTGAFPPHRLIAPPGLPALFAP